MNRKLDPRVLRCLIVFLMFSQAYSCTFKHVQAMSEHLAFLITLTHRKCHCHVHRVFFACDVVVKGSDFPNAFLEFANSECSTDKYHKMLI